MKSHYHPSHLLVEGKDDQHVIWALCEKHSISETFNVVDCEGVENLLQELSIRLKLPNAKIGVLIDADTDPHHRWNECKNILIHQGFTTPDDLPANGFVATNSENKTVGVWMMPNNHTAGMLEDFLAVLIPKGDQLLPIVLTTLDHIEERNLNIYRPEHKSKAVFHTWLAWQENPGTPMGQSITKRYLTTDNETCRRLIEWLTVLFN